MPRVLWKPYGGGAVSCERGTPVSAPRFEMRENSDARCGRWVSQSGSGSPPVSENITARESPAPGEGEMFILNIFGVGDIFKV